MTSPIPPGREGIIPHLVVSDANAAMDFYKKAFGAEELGRAPAPDGKRLMHAELKLGNSIVYLCDDFPEYCGGKSRTPESLGGSPVTIHSYVKDCDAAITKAERAGASVTMPAQDMFWGDRYGVVSDPFGHSWSFATHIRDMSPEQMAEAQQQAFA